MGPQAEVQRLRQLDNKAPAPAFKPLRFLVLLSQGWLFFLKTQTKVAIGPKYLNARKNLGFKTHEPTAIRHAGVPSDLKMPAAPAVGAFFNFREHLAVQVDTARRLG